MCEFIHILSLNHSHRVFMFINWVYFSINYNNNKKLINLNRGRERGWEYYNSILEYSSNALKTSH